MEDLKQAVESAKTLVQQNEIEGSKQLYDLLVRLGATPLNTSVPFAPFVLRFTTDAEVSERRLNLLPALENIVHLLRQSEG